MKQLLIIYTTILFFPFISIAQTPNLNAVVQTGHNTTINDLTVSPDGRFLATGAYDKVIKIWEASSGKLLKTLSNFSYNITSLKFSPNGKILAIGYYGGCTLMNFKTEKILTTLKDKRLNIKDISFNPDGQSILISGSGVVASLWDLKTYQVIKEFEIKDGLYGSDISPDGKYIAVGGGGSLGSTPVEVKIFDAKNYNLIKRFEGIAEKLGCLNFSPDGKTLAIQHSQGKRTLELWNTGTWTKRADGQKVFGGETGSFNQKGNMYIIPNGFGAGFETVDSQSGKLIKRYKEINGKRIRRAIFDPTGNFAYVVVDLNIEFWDIRNHRKLRNFSSGITNQIQSISLSKDDRYLAVAGGSLRRSYAKVWDLQKGELVKSLTAGKDRLTSISFNVKHNKIVTGDRNSKGYIFDFNSGEKVGSIYQGALNTDFSFDGKYLVTGGKSEYNNNSYLHLVNLFDLATNKEITNYDAKERVKSVKFSPDGKFAAVAAGLRCIVLSIPEMRPVHIYEDSKAINAVAISNDGKFIVIGQGYGNNTIWDFNNNKVLLKFKTSGSPSKIVISPDNKVMGIIEHISNEAMLLNISDGTLIKKLKHNDRVNDLVFNSDGSKLFTGSSDHSVTIWEVNSGNKLATLNSIDENEYAILTHDNYYKISKFAIQGMHYVSDFKAIQFDNFDLVYNRPDIVVKRLGIANSDIIASYNKAVKKRLKKMGFSENVNIEGIHLPEIKLITKDIPIETKDQYLNFTIQAKDTQYLLDRLNVYINGVPIYGSNGKSLIENNAKTYSEELKVKLGRGINKIQISTHNEKGFESIRESFEIIYNREEKANDLYIIAIGVSDYDNDEFDLSYAAKDAQDLVKSFTKRTWVKSTPIIYNDPPPSTNTKKKKKKKKEYRPDYKYDILNVHKKEHVFMFLDKNAKKENILAIKDSLMNSDVDDRVVLFVAGHGLLDEKLNYYFGTHDIDFENPSERGLAYEDLEGLLDGIPARKKLMLIDACHSGEVDKDGEQVPDNSKVFAKADNVENGAVKFRGFKNKKPGIGLQNSFKLMQDLFADLRKGTGAMVISSASGAEFAYESPQWNNGVFTYSILEGLKNKKCDPNYDSKVSVSELKNYVSKRVTELTNGLQHPTSRRINLEFDFVVW